MRPSCRPSSYKPYIDTVHKLSYRHHRHRITADRLTRATDRRSALPCLALTCVHHPYRTVTVVPSPCRSSPHRTDRHRTVIPRRPEPEPGVRRPGSGQPVATGTRGPQGGHPDRQRTHRDPPQHARQPGAPPGDPEGPTARPGPQVGGTNGSTPAGEGHTNPDLDTAPYSITCTHNPTVSYRHHHPRPSSSYAPVPSSRHRTVDCRTVPSSGTIIDHHRVWVRSSSSPSSSSSSSSSTPVIVIPYLTDRPTEPVTVDIPSGPTHITVAPDTVAPSRPARTPPGHHPWVGRGQGAPPGRRLDPSGPTVPSRTVPT